MKESEVPQSCPTLQDRDSLKDHRVCIEDINRNCETRPDARPFGQYYLANNTPKIMPWQSGRGSHTGTLWSLVNFPMLFGDL